MTNDVMIIESQQIFSISTYDLGSHNTCIILQLATEMSKHLRLDSGMQSHRLSSYL